MAQPGSEEAVAPLLGEDLRERGLVGLGRGGAQSERHLRQAKLEQAVAAPGLAVIVPLRSKFSQENQIISKRPSGRFLLTGNGSVISVSWR
jgi:hypothetical protein